MDVRLAAVVAAAATAASIATCCWLRAVMAKAATAAWIIAWTATASMLLVPAARLAALLALCVRSVLDQSSTLAYNKGDINDNTYSVAQRKLWVYTALE